MTSPIDPGPEGALQDRGPLRHDAGDRTQPSGWWHGGPKRRWITERVARRPVVVALLTLGTFMGSPPRGTTLVALVVAGAMVVAAPWVAHRWWAWASLLLLAAWGTLVTAPWLDLDNHHVLKLYWLAALALTCVAHDPRATLARAARLLIGFVFAFAVLWKLLTPDFASGEFLTYILSTDRNADRVAAAVGWHDPEVTAENRQVIGELRRHVASAPEPVELTVPERTQAHARTLSLAALALEAAVALMFLMPLRGRWRLAREATLLTFLATTYSVLPVFGFGGLLAAMGLAQSDLTDRRAITLYVSAWAVVGLATVPALGLFG